MTDPAAGTEDEDLELRALALVGTRAAGFAHDAAGKLQSLVLTIEELAMRCEDLRDESLMAEIELARGALAELTGYLQGFRTLARHPAPRDMPLGELLAQAAERAKVVLTGPVATGAVRASPADAVQALALLLEGAAGPAAGQRGAREVEVGIEDRAFVVPPGARRRDVELAAYAFGRGGCTVRCEARGVVVSW